VRRIVDVMDVGLALAIRFVAEVQVVADRVQAALLHPVAGGQQAA
jgi:hypothetical protein